MRYGGDFGGARKPGTQPLVTTTGRLIPSKRNLCRSDQKLFPFLNWKLSQCNKSLLFTKSQTSVLLGRLLNRNSNFCSQCWREKNRILLRYTGLQNLDQPPLAAVGSRPDAASQYRSPWNVLQTCSRPREARDKPGDVKVERAARNVKPQGIKAKQIRLSTDTEKLECTQWLFFSYTKQN